MDQQIFSDGVGQVTIVGGTVRLDLVVYSPTEKDAKGQPVAVFSQRVVMGVDGFLRSAEKIQEAVQALSKLTQLPRAVPAAEPRPELVAPASVTSIAAEPAAASAPPPAAPALRPFP